VFHPGWKRLAVALVVGVSETEGRGRKALQPPPKGAQRQEVQRRNSGGLRSAPGLPAKRRADATYKEAAAASVVQAFLPRAEAAGTRIGGSGGPGRGRRWGGGERAVAFRRAAVSPPGF